MSHYYYLRGVVVRFYKPTSPGMRSRSTVVFTDLSVNRPEQTLTRGVTHRSGGRNNRGVITIRNRGGGHKRLYRLITFNRRTVERASESSGQVLRIEYDPNRTARIALIDYGDALKKRYILSPFSLKVGVIVRTGKRPVLEIGNAMPLFALPTGSSVHNVELKIGGGGKLARSAGAYAKVISRTNDLVTLRLPSGELRAFHNHCYATLGEVGNSSAATARLGKAGRKRWIGFRPQVRGSAMNPNDHPHGGGEGRCPIGRVHPVTPWGKPTAGPKTRKKKKYSDKFIFVTRQNSKR